MKLSRLKTRIEANAMDGANNYHVAEYEIEDKSEANVAQLAHFIAEDLAVYFLTGVMRHQRFFDINEFDGKFYATFIVTGRKDVMRSNLKAFKDSYLRAKKANLGKDCPCDSCCGHYRSDEEKRAAKEKAGCWVFGGVK